MTEIRSTEMELARFKRRILAVALLMLFCFGLLCSRLVYLQIVRHEDLAEQAESNRTAVVPIVPNRGLILDRNGNVLATNYSAYTLEITPSKAGDVEDTIARLGGLMEITPRDRRRFKKLTEESRNFESVPIRTRLSDTEVAKFAAQSFKFPGVEIKARLFRTYPFGELASHVIGYIGRINQREKERIEDSDDSSNYRGTDHIGKLGVEQSFERQLHGTTGVEQMETSAGGRAVRRLATYAAMPGQTVQLSIDIKLQQLVEELFGDRRGALVAIEPSTGEILAFVSKPTFDPNLFVDGIDQESWSALNDSIDKPLLNRALRGTYPTGSTYKPFMGLAGLETGKRTAGTVINDPGFYMFAGHRFGSPEGYLGGVDLQRAIMLSSNVYFYSLANELGVDAIHDFMAPLGFGQITGIDLPGEVTGVLPSTDWKRRTYKRPEQRKWYAGETISLGIGQGYNNFTMLQVAQATSILADGGIKHRPHLVRAVRDPVTGVTTPVEQPAPVNLGFKRSNIDAVRAGLIAVTTGGTARGVFAGAPYVSAGKTGTAQAVTQAQNTKYNARALEEHQRDHALYMAFGPAQDPKIALAVIVENAGWGTGAAAPIARRVLDYWLAGIYPSEEDIAATRIGKSAAPIGTPRKVEDIALPQP
ncbi:penicillin-binding protein 2 [Xylophilus rhododendri]|uniref:Peptidoglycan D,D-transpeptidase MrdA n=1 Tax=Xylophilus rhododendri TaxID=2697032 RepID=A0A857J8F6_9BURK|nr:penicillin-binding protein 2 [Xylophilus rhododendri]QHI99058.1 penicillin-binding protein 2 [Xylophilus rhododendri]